MMRLEDKILIKCTAEALYQMVSDVEGHARLLPGYTESRIIEKKKGTWLIQRAALINGKKRRWKSEVWFTPGQAIHFRQMEGPFKGMEIQWMISPGETYTVMSIVHKLHIQPRWKGWWLERFIAKPAIETTARRVLEAIKSVAEGSLS